jgi:hypothetical protein
MQASAPTLTSVIPGTAEIFSSIASRGVKRTKNNLNAYRSNGHQRGFSYLLTPLYVAAFWLDKGLRPAKKKAEEDS